VLLCLVICIEVAPLTCWICFWLLWSIYFDRSLWLYSFRFGQAKDRSDSVPARDFIFPGKSKPY